MNQVLTGRMAVRWALRVALCYVLVLQTFVAAFATVVAVAPAGSAIAGLVICHNSPTETAGAPDEPAQQAAVPCALCALAASGALVPEATVDIAAPVALRDSPRCAETPAVTAHAHPRAGLSRAPPSFV